MLLLNYSNESFTKTCNRFLNSNVGDNPFCELICVYVSYSSLQAAEHNLIGKERFGEIEARCYVRFNDKYVYIFASCPDKLNNVQVAVLVELKEVN